MLFIIEWAQSGALDDQTIGSPRPDTDASILFRQRYSEDFHIISRIEDAHLPTAQFGEKLEFPDIESAIAYVTARFIHARENQNPLIIDSPTDNAIPGILTEPGELSKIIIDLCEDHEDLNCFFYIHNAYKTEAKRNFMIECNKYRDEGEDITPEQWRINLFGALSQTFIDYQDHLPLGLEVSYDASKLRAFSLYCNEQLLVPLARFYGHLQRTNPDGSLIDNPLFNAIVHIGQYLKICETVSEGLEKQIDDKTLQAYLKMYNHACMVNLCNLYKALKDGCFRSVMNES